MGDAPSPPIAVRRRQGLIILALAVCVICTLHGVGAHHQGDSSPEWVGDDSAVRSVLAAQWDNAGGEGLRLGDGLRFQRLVSAGVQPALAQALSDSMAGRLPAEVYRVARQYAGFDSALLRVAPPVSQARPPRVRVAIRVEPRFHPFPFDPNSIDSAGLMRLGFTPRQARAIVRYRERGGVFRRASDFGRLRVVDSMAYVVLEPYVHIADTLAHMQRARADASRFRPFPFDPNAIDSAGLVRLGFTPRQARAIVRYRERGGVFRRASDFGRLRVVDSMAYATLEPYVQIADTLAHMQRARADASRFRPFPFDPNAIDSAGLVRLGFTPRQARAIVRYRERGGVFRRASDFGRLRVVDSMAYATLEPYVQIADTLAHMQRARADAVRFRSFPFDPNTIDSAGLVLLGFTPRQARAIVRYRDRGGVFRRASDFGRLRVVDSAAYAVLEPYIRVGL